MGLLYQWQRNNGSGWTNMSGQTNTSLNVTVSSTTASYDYRCRVRSSFDSNAQTYSSAAALTQLSNTPTITSHPSNQSGTLNQTANFSVSATVPYGSLSYQWQFNEGSGWQNSGAPGSTSSSISITINSSSDGRQYRCRVTANAGGSVRTSNSASITYLRPPVITSQPSNITATSGTYSCSSLSATSNSGSISYQWQFRPDSSSSWQNSGAGSGNTVCTTVNSSSNGRQYRCILTNNVGSTTSNTITVVCTNC